MTATLKGPWSRTQIDDFLARTRWPLRLACNGSDGFPRVASVWFRLQGDVLECVSHRDSAVVRLLRRDPRAAFEVSPNEPPYFGVRGQVEATLQPLGTAMPWTTWWCATWAANAPVSATGCCHGARRKC